MFGDLESLGLHGAVLLAGFAGGLCYISLQPGRPSLWGACSGIVVGMLTANYLSELAAKYLGLGTSLGPAAFIMGLTATWVCKAIIKRASSVQLDPAKKDVGQ